MVFTKTGAIKGRPGLVTADAAVHVVSGFDVDTQANIAAALTAEKASVPAGIVTSQGSTSSPTPLAMWQGLALAKRDTVWSTAGRPFSARVTKSTVLQTNTWTPASTMRNPVPCGDTVVGLLSGLGVGSGFPRLDDEGAPAYLAVTASLTGIYDSASIANTAAAGDALFFTSTSGTVYGLIPSGAGMTLVTVGATCDTSTSPLQNIAATEGSLDGNGAYLVAYRSSVVGNIELVQLNAAGVVTATGTIAFGTAVVGVAVAFSAGRLCVAFCDAAVNGDLRTKVYNGVFAGIISSAGIDYTVPLTNTGLASSAYFSLGVAHDGSFSIVTTDGTGRDVIVTGRSTTAATISAVGTVRLYGAVPASGLCGVWEPLFAGQVVAGRTLIGVGHFVSIDAATSPSGQWVVLDVTHWYSGTDLARVVVARGPVDGMHHILPSSVSSSTDYLRFAVHEGLTFDTAGIATSAVRRIDIAPQPISSVDAHGCTLVSGAHGAVFDGIRLAAHGFAEEYPRITGVVTAGGGMALGSHSFQATWECTNGRGQVIRSGASNVVTLTTAGANASVSFQVQVPQLRSYFKGVDNVRVRLWATDVAPSADAPLYLVAETTLYTPPTAGFTTLTQTLATDTDAARLYTVGSVLDDGPMPGGDRGVAFTADRAWVADQANVYASKLIRQGIAPAWNAEGLHTLTMPSALGQIQAIAGLQNRLVVVCAAGVAVVAGPGVDDLGNGPGWSTEVISLVGMGSRTPRALTVIPQGVAFLGRDGDVWLITPDLRVQPISRPLGNETAFSDGELTYVESAAGTHPLMFATGDEADTFHRVLDLEAGQWATWELREVTGLYTAGVAGVPYFQMADTVNAATATTGEDLGVELEMEIETGLLKPQTAGPRGWGRVRSLSLHEASASYYLSVLVKDADGTRTLMDKQNLVLSALQQDWPSGLARDIRCTTQRCTACTVTLTAIPAVAEWSSIDLWVANSGEMAPTSNNRS